MFVIPSEDDHSRFRHCLNSLDRGVDIRSLAVIDIGYAIQFAHPFNPVFHTPECFQRMPYHRHRHFHGTGYAYCTQGIFQVMRTGDIDLICPADPFLAAVHPQPDGIVPHKSAFPYFLFPAELHHFAVNLFGQSVQGRIIRVEYCVVRRCLVPEHTHFHCRVDLHGPVPVQVVLRNIGQQCHMGMEGICRLHLERRNLTDDHVILPAHQRSQGKRIADIAHHMGYLSAVGKDLAQQGDRSRFSVRAADSCKHPAGQLSRQFQFADDIDPHFLCFHDKRCGVRDAGGDHETILSFKELHCSAAESACQLQPFERIQLCSQFLFTLAVIHRDVRSAGAQQLGRRNTAAGHTNDKNLFLIKIHLDASSQRMLRTAARLSASVMSAYMQTIWVSE